MIRHVVLVRFDPTTSTSERDAIFAELAGLRAQVPGLLAFSGGPNVSPEGLARGYTHGFAMDFASAGARDAYLLHPAHRAAGERLVRAAQDGIDGIAVLDFAFGEKAL